MGQSKKFSASPSYIHIHTHILEWNSKSCHLLAKLVLVCQENSNHGIFQKLNASEKMRFSDLHHSIINDVQQESNVKKISEFMM